MHLPTALRHPTATLLKHLPREPKHIPRYSDVPPELPGKFLQHLDCSKSTSLKYARTSLESLPGSHKHILCMTQTSC